MPQREGFVCAGTWCWEHVKTIAHYPEAGAQATILREHTQAGGSAFAALSALRRFDADLPLYALGMIGEDEDGRALLAACHKLEADTFQLQTTAEAPTAHAVVIHAEHENARTRFYFPGANHLLAAEHFDFKHCLASWLHLSDYDLLERLHLPEAEFGAAAGKIFHAARAAGLSTALTVTAPEKILGANPLAQTLDYLILTARALEAFANEHAPSGEQEAAARLLQQGLRCGLALLGADRAWAMLRTGEQAEIKFSPPANAKNLSATSFGAGFLYGRYAGWNLERCLAAATVSQ